MRFVTREKLHVDRIATAWVILRFVDPQAAFVFIPRTAELDGRPETPFDVRGAELSHRGERCTFEVACEQYGLTDAALAAMGSIIRGADLPYDDGPAPEAAGVRAVFDGIRDAKLTDDERLALGLPVCDALFAYCQERASEKGSKAEGA
jgi:hypothetical protein